MLGKVAPWVKAVVVLCAYIHTYIPTPFHSGVPQARRLATQRNALFTGGRLPLTESSNLILYVICVYLLHKTQMRTCCIKRKCAASSHLHSRCVEILVTVYTDTSVLVVACYLAKFGARGLIKAGGTSGVATWPT